MGQRFPALNERHRRFIEQQKMFFVGTAAAAGRVNVSPKGGDYLRVLDRNRVVWLNLTGSTNESSAHVQMLDRMTIMFCSFDGEPLILRLFGHARVVHPRDAEWTELYAQFAPNPGARQLFVMDIDLVQTSCGMAVPNYKYVAERVGLDEWAAKKSPDAMVDYWREKNQLSLDNFPTNILEEE